MPPSSDPELCGSDGDPATQSFSRPTFLPRKKRGKREYAIQTTLGCLW